MPNQPEELKSKNNEIKEQSKIKKVSLTEENKNKENEIKNKLYDPTFLLAIATFGLLIVNAILVYYNNAQFQTINRPILSVGNIEGFVDNQTKTITFNLFLENSGNLPAKYNINKLSYFDQNGKEIVVPLQFPSSVVFPKSANRFVYFPVPFGVINNGYLNLTLNMVYTNLFDSSKTYFYEEKFRFDLLHETFGTIDANGN